MTSLIFPKWTRSLSRDGILTSNVSGKAGFLVQYKRNEASLWRSRRLAGSLTNLLVKTAIIVVSQRFQLASEVRTAEELSAALTDNRNLL